MIIKDINGNNLLLGKTWLKEPPEVDGYAVRLSEIRVRVKEIKREKKKSADLYLIDVNDMKKRDLKDWDFTVDICPTTFRIGCRVFDEKTFKKILRAAGVKK